MHTPFSRRSSSSVDRALGHSAQRQVEALEGRRLLSVTLTSGVLALVGGAGNDAYNLVKNGTNVSVTENGGTAKLFPLASVTRINASLGGGNDTLYIATTLMIPASVSGGDGADGIITGSGDDTIDPGTGDDYIDGRDGLDTVTYASRSTPVNGELHENFHRNRDPVTGQKLSTTSDTSGHAGGAGEDDEFINVETIAGGSGDDTLYCNADPFYVEEEADLPYPPNIPMRLNGNGGNDDLHATASYAGSSSGFNDIPSIVADGGDGNDSLEGAGSRLAPPTLVGGIGNDYFLDGQEISHSFVDPGPGYDTYDYSSPDADDYTMPAGLEELHEGGGATHSQTIIGNDEDNVIVAAFAGEIDGKGGNDRIVGPNGGAGLYGGAGNDTIIGGSSSDYIVGGEGDDSLDGGYGNDSIYSEGGNDYINGDAGNDFIYAGGHSTIDGGADRDSIQLVDESGSVNGGDGDDNIYCRVSDASATLNGGSGADILLIDGSTSNSNDNYTVSPTSVQISKAVPTQISYSGFGIVELWSGTGNNLITVNNIPANFQLWITDFGGADTLDVRETPMSSIVQAALDPDDTLLVNTDNIGVAHVEIRSSMALAELSIGAQGTVQVVANSEHNALRVRALIINQLGSLELGDNPLIVDYAPSEASPLVAITALLRSGRANGAGIESSTVRGTPGTALGVADASELFSTFPATIAGQSVDSTSVIVRYTRSGDLNLDRKVDFADLLILAQNFGATARSYGRGNIDYSADGSVNFSDLLLLAQGFGSTLATEVATKRSSSIASQILVA